MAISEAVSEPATVEAAVKTVTQTMYFDNGVATYSSDGTDSSYGRLSQFQAADPDYEGTTNMLAYMRIVEVIKDGEGITRPYATLDKAYGDIDTVLNELAVHVGAQEGGVSKSLTGSDLISLRSSLMGSTTKYTKFILTGVQHSRREKSQIIPTFGDSYSAIFTGAEPSIVTFSANLICDHSSDYVLNATTAGATGAQMSWYHGLHNAYHYFLRASRLAKWWLRLRIEVPGFSAYEGYIISMDDSLNSNDDHIIPVTFSMLLVEPNIAVPGMAANSSINSSTTVTAAAAAAKSKAVSRVTSAGTKAMEELNARSKTVDGIQTAVDALTRASTIKSSLDRFQTNLARNLKLLQSSAGFDKIKVLNSLLAQTNRDIDLTRGYANLLNGSVLGQQSSVGTVGGYTTVSPNGKGRMF